MTQNKNIQTRVGYAVDQGSVAAVQQANQKVAASFETVQAATAGWSADMLALNPQLAQQAAATQTLADTQILAANATSQQTAAAAAQRAPVQDLTDLYDGLDQKVKFVIADIGDLGRDIERMPLPDIGSLPGESAAVGGGVGASLRGASQAAIALPNVGYQSPLVVGLRAASLAADATGASMAQVALSLGFVGAALLIVKVGLDMFNEGLEANKNRLSAALSAQSNYYDAIGSLTTAQAQATIAERERKQAILETQLAETQAAINSQNSIKGSNTAELAFSATTNFLFRGLIDATGATADLTDRAKDLKGELAENTDTITRLNQGVEAGSFAANTLAEAEKQLGDLRKQLADSARQQYDIDA